MKMPDWYMEEFFPSGELRDAVVNSDGSIKNFSAMEPRDIGPWVGVLGDVRCCAKALTAMREPVVAKALGVPYLGDLIPDKYHVYRHMPPYWAMMWYKKKLTPAEEWGDERFVADYLTAVIIEFPWEQSVNKISRTPDKKKHQWVSDTKTNGVFAYHTGTLKAVTKMLEAFKLPINDDLTARIFISRFIWYCYIMHIDTLMTEMSLGAWAPGIITSDIRSFINRCIYRDKGELLLPGTNIGGWGGLMTAALAIGKIGEVGFSNTTAMRMKTRLRMMLLLILAAMSPVCAKKILEGLMTFSSTLAGIWVLDLVKPLLKEVDMECQ